MRKKQRISNFELLRIVAIVQVLILHYLNGDMGGALKNTTQGTKIYYSIVFIESLCIIAVNSFVIITGYFMIGKTFVKLEKIINLVIMTIFYGGILFIISSVFLKIQPFDMTKFLDSLIFVYGTKWFVGAYAILFVLIPYLNKIVININKNQYKKFILILIMVFSILPTIFPKIRFNDRGYGVLGFIMMYFIGGYLKLHYKNNKSKTVYFLIYLLCSILTSVGVLLKLKTNVFWNYNSIINVISSVSLFLFFSKLNIKSNIINYLSTYSFAIYIIHADSSVCNFIYRNIFNSDSYWNSNLIFINMIKSVIGIYILCSVIELVRRIIIKPINKKITLFNHIEIHI